MGTAVAVINAMFDYLFDLFDWSSPLNRIFRQFIVGLFCVSVIAIVCARDSFSGTDDTTTARFPDKDRCVGCMNCTEQSEEFK